jgi:asparagine synthase
MTAPSPQEAPLRLRIRWPGLGAGGECDNFFVGAWHPSRSLAADWIDFENRRVTHLEGRNWVLASATEPRQGLGLVHRDDVGGAVAFRGYVLPDVHSYSSSAAIRKSWLDTTAARNGVFSAAVIGRDGASLTLATDTLGMGALYWRRLGEAVLYATNPRYLVCSDDEADRLAWRCLVQTLWIGSDRSLTAAVKRVPAGCSMTFAGTGEPVLSSPAWAALPEGRERVNSRTLGEVEQAFQQAVDRCVRLRGGRVMLPLSSGFDSRRILAALLHRRVEFKAVTYRALQQSHRDLDARFASQMARDFGFPHVVVDADDTQYVADDVSRRTLLDAEAHEHAWSMRVHAVLSEGCEVFFDGIAGDILGDPVGWLKLTGLAISARAPENEIESIARHAIGSSFDGVLAPAAWPSAEELRADLGAYLRRLLQRANLGELAFLLLRQRRAIALWSQQLTAPGIVPLYPYLDVDYLRATLALLSEDKHRTNFQRSCLREFWPRFYRYGGNRDIPLGMPAGSPARDERRTVRCIEQLLQEIRAAGAMSQLRELLTPKGKLLLAASRSIPPLAVRWAWFLIPLMELVSRQGRRVPVWEPVEAS